MSRDIDCHKRNFNTNFLHGLHIFHPCNHKLLKPSSHLISQTLSWPSLTVELEWSRSKQMRTGKDLINPLVQIEIQWVRVRGDCGHMWRLPKLRCGSVWCVLTSLPSPSESIGMDYITLSCSNSYKEPVRLPFIQWEKQDGVWGVSDVGEPRGMWEIPS